MATESHIRASTASFLKDSVRYNHYIEGFIKGLVHLGNKTAKRKAVWSVRKNESHSKNRQGF